jgi:hypothetical protein
VNLVTCSLPVGEATLRAHCRQGLLPGAHWMLGQLARFADEPPGLAPGVKVEFGWSLLWLREDGDVLAVCEPDFEGDPMRDQVDDVTGTLSVLAAQSGVLSEYKVAEPVPTRFDQKIVVAKGVLDLDRVYLERTAPQPGDSGWYIGPVDEGDQVDESASPEDRYDAILAHELLGRRPALVTVLSLPLGALVVFDGDEIVHVGLDG